jgi:hypothetical protein
MDPSTIVMMVAAAITLAVVSKGLNATAALFLEIMPRMVAAFIIAGLIQAVVLHETIVR